MSMNIEAILNEVWPDYYILGDAGVGRGAFATVYRAGRRDRVASSNVAIKVIRIPKDADEVDLLRMQGYSIEETTAFFREMVNDCVKEIDLMDKLKGQPNIVYIEDYKIYQAQEDDTWYILIRMPLLTPVLKRFERDREISEEQILRLGIDMCRALEACEHAKIVHRDIKPENIMSDVNGNYLLGDFGVARRLENATHGLTKSGTPNYMAPELARAAVSDDFNQAKLVDIYSLGLVLYYLGNRKKLPFYPTDRQLVSSDERQKAFEMRITGKPLPGPCAVSEDLQRVILRAAAYEPSERYQNAREMRHDLEALLEKQVGPLSRSLNPTAAKEITVSPVSAPEADTVSVSASAPDNGPAGTSVTGEAPPQRKKRTLLIAAIAALAVLAAVLGIVLGNRGGAPAPTPTPSPAAPTAAPDTDHDEATPPPEETRVEAAPDSASAEAARTDEVRPDPLDALATFRPFADSVTQRLATDPDSHPVFVPPYLNEDVIPGMAEAAQLGEPDLRFIPHSQFLSVEGEVARWVIKPSYGSQEAAPARQIRKGGLDIAWTDKDHPGDHPLTTLSAEREEDGVALMYAYESREAGNDPRLFYKEIAFTQGTDSGWQRLTFAIGFPAGEPQITAIITEHFDGPDGYWYCAAHYDADGGLLDFEISSGHSADRRVWELSALGDVTGTSGEAEAAFPERVTRWFDLGDSVGIELPR